MTVYLNALLATLNARKKLRKTLEGQAYSLPELAVPSLDIEFAREPTRINNGNPHFWRGTISFEIQRPHSALSTRTVDCVDQTIPSISDVNSHSRTPNGFTDILSTHNYVTNVVQNNWPDPSHLYNYQSHTRPMKTTLTSTMTGCL